MLKDVTCNDHKIRLQLNGLVHQLPEGRVEVFASGIEIVLSVTQMQISRVNKTERFDYRFPSCFRPLSTP